jgi:thiamine-phosphate pyrophosphorylase
VKRNSSAWPQLSKVANSRLRAESLLLCYITDRTALASDEATRRQRLLEKIAEAARAGVEYIQLREKDLPIRELESLAQQAMGVLNQLRTKNRELRTALLINSRTDVALAAGADGVHLRSGDISAEEVRAIWRTAHVGTAALGCPAQRSYADAVASDKQRPVVIGVSCHSSAEVAHAAASGATFAVFGPVFEKGTADPKGLEVLREACRHGIPVLALGGVTLANARSCVDAGAAGIAGIRLFQENDICTAVRDLRGRAAR